MIKPCGGDLKAAGNFEVGNPKKISKHSIVAKLALSLDHCSPSYTCETGRNRGGSIGCANVRFGSWLCENAATLNRDRRTYSSKVFFEAQLESELNLGTKLKNIILDAFRFSEFLHSKGQKRTSR